MIIYFGLIFVYWFYRQTNIKLLTECIHPDYSIGLANSISIVTFNIQKFPWKTKSLAPLAKLLGQYDIILLQECFDELNESLGNLFPSHNICRAGLTKLKLLNSGLAILSRFPVSDIVFYPFVNCNVLTSDYLCEKGILSCKIRWKNKLITIYNTHLQSSHTSPYDPIALKQFNELNNFVKISGSVNYVIAGDFNIDHKKIIRHFNLFNVFAPEEPTIYINWESADSIPYAKPNYTGLVYDYFISDLELKQTKTIRTSYSDHLPVQTIVL